MLSVRAIPIKADESENNLRIWALGKNITATIRILSEA
jgi:hypothetical protein